MSLAGSVMRVPKTLMAAAVGTSRTAYATKTKSMTSLERSCSLATAPASRSLINSPENLSKFSKVFVRGFSMSLQRRACYKCGAVGHFAEACSSPERLCYNCKQPGHESNACPHPRTTETKQCYHCQGLGHVQADCPTLRIAGGAPTSSRCYNCGNPGHLARNCPMGGAVGAGRGGMPGRVGGFRGGYAAARPSATCYKCGGPNHYARDCQAQAMKCYSCGKLGHISKECPAPNGGPLSTAGKTCYTCGEPGHIARDCSQQPSNQGQPIQQSNEEQAPAAPVVASLNINTQ